MSHTTVGNIMLRVGKTQAESDKAMVSDLEEAAQLPEGKKKVNFLYTEADGVYVRGLKKRKHIEVSHGIMYEGWDINGDRVSLKSSKVIMTTKSIDHFWDEVRAFSANEYSLKNTQIVSNSEGGAESMVKVKQGIANNTLKKVYLISCFTAEKLQETKKG